jgi:hypothetical protein
MPTLKKGNATTVEVRAGQRLDVSAGGIVSQVGGGLVYDFTGWPAVIGAFTTDQNFTINALDADIEYEVLQAQEYAPAVVEVLDDDLPAVGRTGVLYSTELGLKYWYQPTGQFLSLDGAPNAPVNDEQPVIAGDAEVGAVLTVVDNGDWSNRPTSFSYQWEIDGSEVEGATGIAFTVPSEAEGEDVTCVVTAENIVGTETSTSNEISIPSDE